MLRIETVTCKINIVCIETKIIVPLRSNLNFLMKIKEYV